MSRPSTRSQSDILITAARPAPWVRWLPLLAGTLWGTAFPAVALALETFTPFDVAFGRAFIGAVTLGAVLLWRGALRYHFPPATWGRLFVLAQAGAGFFWTFHTLAVRYGTPVNAAFIVGTYPAMVAAAAPLVVGERLRRQDVVSLLLALVGVYLIVGQGEVRLFKSDTALGDLFALLAAVLFGSYLLLGRRWRGTLGVSSEELTWYTFVFALPVLALLALLDGVVPALPTWRSAGALLWLGCMTTTAAFLAINEGMRVGAVARSSLHLFVFPPVATITTWLIFGTALSGVQWIGGGLVLLGILLAGRS
ncbi:MAG: DMT family transporter [Ardenticatenia bacterium]|nr:DMT family transporter [Ardenticatenia bacterium]